MGNFDGDVKIRVSLDSKGVEKGADRVKRRMESLGKTVLKTFSVSARKREIEDNIDAYEKQAQAVEKTIRAEKEHLAELKKLQKEIEYDPKARDLADQMGIADFDEEIDAAYRKIADAKKEIRDFNAEIRKSGKEIENIGQVTNPVAAGIDRIGKRMNGLARRVFIFGIVLQGLRAMKDGIVRLLKTDSAVSKSMEQIKGSMVAAFMPIYNLCLPAIRWLMSALAQLASGIANTVRQISSLIGSIFGIDTSSMANADALKEQADATTAAGNAAKKAAKHLAAFDEINQLADESASSGSGSGSGSGAAASGKWDLSGLDNVSKKMQTISEWVLAIGAGIAGWRIAKALGALGNKTWLGNLATIAGNAGIIYNAFRRLLPNIQSIVKEGPQLKNVLGAMDGIFGIMGSLALSTGNVGAALAFFALQAGAAIAQDWDKVPAEMKWWEKAIDPVIRGFKELADLVVKLLTEPIEFDILAEIGNMSFSAKGIAALATASLISTIGKMLHLKGKIWGKAGVVMIGLMTAFELYADIKDVMDSGEGTDRSNEIKKLVVKWLFGVAAGMVGSIIGPAGIILAVPIGLKLGTYLADVADLGEDQHFLDTNTLDLATTKALKTADSVKKLKKVVETFTGLKIDDASFARILTEYGTGAYGSTENALEGMKADAKAFMLLFRDKSNSEGFDAWIKTLGVLNSEHSSLQEELEDFGKKYNEYMANLNKDPEKTDAIKNNAKHLKTTDKAAQGANETLSAMFKTIGSIASGIKEKLGKDSETTYTDMEDGATSTGNGMKTTFGKAATSIANLLKFGAKTAGNGMETTLGLTMVDIDDTMKSGATSTSKGMVTTFDSAGSKIRKSLLNNFSGVFAEFGSGGKIYNGIVGGIGNIFVAVVNKLINGLNQVMEISFDRLNKALDMIRNTRVAGIKPFISLPRVSIAKIPKLAQGAVIPANNEFLAVLGDQKQGTNIEAPLDTIVEAVMIAMAKSGMDGSNLASAVRAALQGLSLKVGKREIGYIVADAINANRRSDGKLALNL